MLMDLQQKIGDVPVPVLVVVQDGDALFNIHDVSDVRMTQAYSMKQSLCVNHQINHGFNSKLGA